ncbi:IS630 transposase-related protein [Wolbachia endosymbiont (group B) of Ennomos erosarius]|uniref:IS630 transposase-related protein n=1 Tax=Wolbachia endosymbiont (group B) of Ennomos erosarius TaxID=3066175 RepID=UPI00313327D6
MASPYQYELRERVISAVESGMAVVKVKEIFKVGRATIYANSGLRKEESIGNRRLFGFDGIGNESRKDMNQKINRGSMASVFNF